MRIASQERVELSGRRRRAGGLLFALTSSWIAARLKWFEVVFETIASASSKAWQIRLVYERYPDLFKVRHLSLLLLTCGERQDWMGAQIIRDGIRTFARVDLSKCNLIQAR